MSQSSLDVTKWVFYKASTKARRIIPSWRDDSLGFIPTTVGCIYADGELMPDGVQSGMYIKWKLSGYWCRWINDSFVTWRAYTLAQRGRFRRAFLRVYRYGRTHTESAFTNSLIDNVQPASQ